MKATDRRLPIATGNIPFIGAALNWNIPNISITLVPIIVKEKCKNERKTMKLYPSTSVIYLLQITIPTTDKTFPTTPTTIDAVLDDFVVISNEPRLFLLENLFIMDCTLR